MPIAPDIKLGRNVRIMHPELVNLYGCTIGSDTKIGPFVEIQKNVVIGQKCKIASHSLICDGVTIEDEVFIGHGVIFINDRYPRSTINGRLKTQDDWELIQTLVKKGASIGSGSVIMCGITIGINAMIGAGTVVTHNVPDNTLAYGVPAKNVKKINDT